MAWVHVTMSEYNAPDGESAEMRLASEPLCKCGFFFTIPPSSNP